eukprot:8330261-Alexandrium_andersonii.AAC.1
MDAPRRGDPPHGLHLLAGWQRTPPTSQCGGSDQVPACLGGCVPPAAVVPHDRGAPRGPTGPHDAAAPAA